MGGVLIEKLFGICISACLARKYVEIGLPTHSVDARAKGRVHLDAL